MKLSIIIEDREDFELVLPLIGKIERIQKEGKYLFYRMVCVCEKHEEKEFKQCLKTHKVNVPYSFWKKTTAGKIVQDADLPNFFEEELFRNPVEMVLLTKNSEITTICAQIARLYQIKVALLEHDTENATFPISANYRFPLNNLEDADKMITKIIDLFKL